VWIETQDGVLVNSDALDEIFTWVVQVVDEGEAEKRYEVMAWPRKGDEPIVLAGFVRKGQADRCFALLAQALERGDRFFESPGRTL
jgi:hypothetical protein